MMNNNFGGNRVSSPKLNEKSYFEFCSSPYVYRYQTISKGQKLLIDDLNSFTVFIYDQTNDAVVACDKFPGQITKHGAFQIESSSLCLEVNGGEIKVLVAGVKQSILPTSITYRTFEQLKKVSKPWGHELWINDQHPGYALKQIFIKATHKTSLQYHNFKSETNVLVSGQAKLHYNATNVPNSAVTSEDIKTVDLDAVSIVSVTPPTLHRLEAVTDILLYEASTPHLDDVVRIADDSNRPDGRIDAEHAPK